MNPITFLFIVMALFTGVFAGLVLISSILPSIIPLSGDKNLDSKYVANQKAYDTAVLETQNTEKFKEAYFKCLKDFNGFFRVDWENHNWSSEVTNVPVGFDPYCRVELKENVWQTFHMVKKENGWELLDDKVFPNDGDGHYP